MHNQKQQVTLIFHTNNQMIKFKAESSVIEFSSGAI